MQQIITQPPLNDQKISSTNTTNLVILQIFNPADPSGTVTVALDLGRSMVYFAADNQASASDSQQLVGVSIDSSTPAGSSTSPSLSGADLTNSFQEGEARSEQETAEKLGLPAAGLSQVPSTEQLRVLLKAVSDWMRSQPPR